MKSHVASTSAGELMIREFAGEKPALVCLHGFTLHGGMFTSLAEHLPQAIAAPDLPGHGGTRIRPVDLPTTLDALAAGLQRSGSPHIVLGYSQGGRLALHLAARHPELVRHVIAVSTSLGIVAPDERAARRRADEMLAQRIETLGIASFLEEWSRHPLVGTAGLDPVVAARDRHVRSENTAAGLAAALRGLGQGVVPPISCRELRCTVTWVAGERDDRYRTAAEKAAARLGGRAFVVAGAGHNVVLEAPGALAGIVGAELRRLS